MNILVTGSNGQLGSEFKDLSETYSEHKFFFTSRKDLDITNKLAVENFIEAKGINSVINCAAYTAVDKAETEPELADRINHLAVKSLSEIAKEKKVNLIHISTDYVFNGKGYRPYPVDHLTDPVNVYGKTKLAGENAMKAVNPLNSIIIRTSWVYSSYGNNFVKTMLRLGEEKEELKIISDQIGAPTYARDLAKFILDHTQTTTSNNVQVYHYTNEGVCSWYDFAKEIMEIGEKDCIVSPIPTSEYPTPANRPYYSVMDKSSLKKAFSIELPYWKKSLKEFNIKLQTTL